MAKLNVRIRNFRVFNFRCLSNWQKNVNSENFLIYSTELVQKITLIEIVTQQTVHLASPLYHGMYELLSVVLLAGRETITVCS